MGLGIKLKENRVLVERFKAEEKIGSIIVMQEEQVIPEGGLIVSVGPDVVGLAIGERVRFYEHGMEVSIGDEDYYLLRDGDVWGEVTN